MAGLQTIGEIIYKRAARPSPPQQDLDDPLSTFAGGDVPIPVRVLADPEISWMAKAVYGCLNRFRVMSYGGRPYPSQLYLSLILGQTERYVRKALAELRHRGWVKVHRRGRAHTSSYTLASEVPDVALPDVIKTENSLANLRLDRNNRSGQAAHDRNNRSGITTRAVVPEGTTGAAAGAVSYSLSIKEEVRRTLFMKRTRCARKDHALGQWRDLVQKSPGGADLVELLKIVQVNGRTAEALVKNHAPQQIKAVCANVFGDVKTIPGFIVTGLKEGWRFKPTVSVGKP